MPGSVFKSICDARQFCLLKLSIFDYANSETAVLALFIIMLGITLLLTFKYRKTWMYLVLVYFFAAIRMRYPFAVNGGDAVLIWTLFWAAFVKLPAHNSTVLAGDENIFRIRNRSHLFILLHAVLFYFYAGQLKTGFSWSSGMALEYVYHNDFMRTDFLDFLAEQKLLNFILTPMVIVFETFAAFLLFIPSKLQRLRLVLCLSFFAFHLSMGLVLRTSPLPELGFAIWVLFLPSLFWARIWIRIPSTAHAWLIKVEHYFLASKKEVLGPKMFFFGCFVFLLGFTNQAKILVHKPPVWLSNMNIVSVALGLGQNWIFFPAPGGRSGSVLTYATTTEGQNVVLDPENKTILLTDVEFIANPRMTIYRNRRWAKIYARISEQKSPVLLLGMEYYICRTYKGQITNFRIMYHPTYEMGVAPEDLTKPVNLYSATCGRY